MKIIIMIIQIYIYTFVFYKQPVYKQLALGT